MGTIKNAWSLAAPSSSGAAPGTAGAAPSSSAERVLPVGYSSGLEALLQAHAAPARRETLQRKKTYTVSPGMQKSFAPIMEKAPYRRRYSNQLHQYWRRCFHRCCRSRPHHRGWRLPHCRGKTLVSVRRGTLLRVVVRHSCGRRLPHTSYDLFQKTKKHLWSVVLKKPETKNRRCSSLAWCLSLFY